MFRTELKFVSGEDSICVEFLIGSDLKTNATMIHMMSLKVVRLNLFKLLVNFLPQKPLELYKGNGLAIRPNTFRSETRRIKKWIKKVFQSNKLLISIETIMHKIDFFRRHFQCKQREILNQ